MDSKEQIKAQLAALKQLAVQENINLDEDMQRIQQKLAALEIEEEPKELTAWDRVALARHKNRPTTMDYIHQIIDDFMELHGDRGFRDDPAVIGGIGFLAGTPVTVIGHQKGRDVKENIHRNFGMAHPEGYRKSLRLMKQAEKFGRPVIAFIDTPGAYCGLGAEERGQGEAIARNLFEMADLQVPIISVIIGEGGSGGALAFGIGDRVYMLENTIYSILSPEGFASILWKDASKAQQAAGVMKITAKDLHAYDIIDDVIQEVDGGAHLSLEGTAGALKEKLIEDIATLAGKDSGDLTAERYEKFRKLGKVSEV